nr:serine/arginine-rich splicing factor RS31-like isoform X2 [Tanacetum cinerariifolium]
MGERGRHRDGSKSVANQRPTKTLFIINFEPIHTRVHDIEKHFEPYENVLHVRIRRNFAFVQFETQEEATKALECTHMSKILDRVVSVVYALRDDGVRGSRSISPRRDYGRRGPGVMYMSPTAGNGFLHGYYICNEFVDSLFAFADRYCCGYKLVGAGGGGFALLLAKNGENAQQLRQALEENNEFGFR